MPFEVLYSYILLVRPRKLIARCAILSHEPKITEATLVSSPPRSPPSEGFHLATTMKKLVFSVASRATGRLQIKPSGSGDENGVSYADIFVRLCAREAKWWLRVGSKIQTVRKQVRASAPLRCTRVNKLRDIFLSEAENSRSLGKSWCYNYMSFWRFHR